MKRLLLATVLALSLCFSLTGCGGAEAKNEAATEQTKDKKEDEQEANTADESLFSSDDTSDKVEEAPEASTPAERPTSRTATYNNGTIEETIEYADDGSYTVTRPIYGDTFSFDCITTYSKRGEVIGYKRRYYDSEYPDGVDDRETKFVMGYPISTSLDGEIIDDCIADGTTVVNGDKVEMSEYENASIMLNANNHPANLFNTNDLQKRTIYDVASYGVRGLDISNVSELKWGSQYSDKEAIIYAYYDVDCYDSKARSNSTRPIYVSIDVIKYNDLDLVESVETYWTNREPLLLDFAPDHLDDVTCEEYVHYTYDKDGNLIQEEGRTPGKPYYTYTYEYGSSSASSDSDESGIVGKWFSTDTGADSSSYIQLDDDGTGYPDDTPTASQEEDCIVGDWYPEGSDSDSQYYLTINDDGTGVSHDGNEERIFEYTFDGFTLRIKWGGTTRIQETYYYDNGVLKSSHRAAGTNYIKK